MRSEGGKARSSRPALLADGRCFTLSVLPAVRHYSPNQMTNSNQLDPVTATPPPEPTPRPKRRWLRIGWRVSKWYFILFVLLATLAVWTCGVLACTGHLPDLQVNDRPVKHWGDTLYLLYIVPLDAMIVALVFWWGIAALIGVWLRSRKLSPAI